MSPHLSFGLGAYFLYEFDKGLWGGSGPQRLTRALGIETGNPIMTFEQRSSFLPATERAPHHTSTENPIRAVLLRLDSVAGFAEPALPLNEADTDGMMIGTFITSEGESLNNL